MRWAGLLATTYSLAERSVGVLVSSRLVDFSRCRQFRGNKRLPVGAQEAAFALSTSEAMPALFRDRLARLRLATSAGPSVDIFPATLFPLLYHPVCKSSSRTTEMEGVTSIIAQHEPCIPAWGQSV